MPSPALTPVQQDQAWATWRTGQLVRSIARDVGVATYHVSRHFGATGGVRVCPVGRSARHLSLIEREEISRGLAAGLSFRRIAIALGRPSCTVLREVARNGGRRAYRAHGAESAAYARGKRPKVSKLATWAVLRATVEHGLSEEWSREQISRRLVLNDPNDAAMRISHEAIYLSLLIPKRAPLPRRLTQQLRTGRSMRYPKVARQPSGRGRLKDMTSWRDRPAEVAGRAVPGHWKVTSSPATTRPRSPRSSRTPPATPSWSPCLG